MNERKPLSEEEKRERQKEYTRRYFAKHPEQAEKNKERSKAYYHEHRDEIMAYNRKYSKTHSLALSEYRHAYYMKNRERILAYSRERHQKKKEAEG